jgi:hypothetical protein
MSRTAASFKQVDITRAAKAAAAAGPSWRVEIAEGVIRLIQGADSFEPPPSNVIRPPEFARGLKLVP